MIKKTARKAWIGAALALAGAVVLAVLAVAPEPVEAGGGCLGDFLTSTHHGFGPTCEDSQLDALSKAFAEANVTCAGKPVCVREYKWWLVCEYEEAWDRYVSSVQLRYGCFEGINPPPPF